MGVPETWTRKWAHVSAATDRRMGKSYEIGYAAPAETTLTTVEVSVPIGTTYPGESGVFAPTLRNARIEGDGDDGLSLVVLRYDPPLPEEVPIYKDGYVLVEVRSENTAERPFVDLDGEYVWHSEYDETGGVGCKWEPVAGTGVLYDRRMQFRVRFCKDYGIGGNLLSYQNTINGAVYTQFWNCPAGSLRFAAWEKHRAPTIDKKWMYDCLVEYNPHKWNEETKVQKYELRAYQIPVREEDGTEIADTYREIRDWFPVGETYNARLYESTQWPLILGTYDW